MSVLAERNALMSRHSGGPWRADASTWSDVGPWETMPRWHPARLFGFDLWRDVQEDLQGSYHYKQWGRSKKVAREMLHSAYGEKPCSGNAEWDGVLNTWRSHVT